MKEELMTVVAAEPLVRAASLAELRATGRLVVHVERHTLCLFADGDEVYAVDNRCPHMGFPLHRGTLCDGILTCHWHHARFELSTGGTFDQWADDLRRFPVELRGDDVLLDLSALEDLVEHQRKRLRDGLERDIPLVLAKATLALLKADPAGIATFCDGLDFGVARRGGGWFRGLTTLTCLMNLLPRLVQADRAAALHHGLADVAANSAGEPPRFRLAPLPGRVDPAQLTRWFRGFIEVRDAEGAERALLSAAQAGASSRELADMLFAAATDHRYLDGGHTLDFVNKALEALDVAGWDRAEPVLASLPAQLAGAERMEEANAWRNPVDLVALLERAFEELPRAAAAGADRRGRWDRRLDRQQQVEEARQLAVSFLAAGGRPRSLVAALGAALVRENRNFHTIQCVEAAARQQELLAGSPEEPLPLIAAAGYLAAHATTTRSQHQTFEIARRLHRGEKLYENDAA